MIENNIIFSNEILEKINECLKSIRGLFEKIKNMFLNIFESIKEIIIKQVIVKKSKYKKGNKYIHSYIKVPIWKLLVGDLE